MSEIKKTYRLHKVSLINFRGKRIWGNYDKWAKSKRANGVGVAVKVSKWWNHVRKERESVLWMRTCRYNEEGVGEKIVTRCICTKWMAPREKLNCFPIHKCSRHFNIQNFVIVIIYVNAIVALVISMVVTN